MPLYVLGFMGATRRLDHYDPSMGWQELFVVAGVGVGIICLGIAFQLLQIAVSFLQRKKNRDISGDPWDGRTLEWATASPPPEYNFAQIPVVYERDAFWALKQDKPQGAKKAYENITVPKNSGIGVFVGAFSFIFGFAVVWHIVWLAAVGLIGVLAVLIIRLSQDETERVIPAAEVAKTEDRGFIS
jgi:cytochrome o ubiquinol oxidase subunit 1